MLLRAGAGTACSPFFAVEGEGRAGLRRAGQSARHSGSGIDGFWIHVYHRQWDREPHSRCGFDRGRPAASARQDGPDRRRDAVADATWGSRRAPGLFHGSCAEPGRRGDCRRLDARERDTRCSRNAFSTPIGLWATQRPGRRGLPTRFGEVIVSNGWRNCEPATAAASADAEGGNTSGAGSDRAGDDSWLGSNAPATFHPRGSRGADQPRRPAPQAQGLGPRVRVAPLAGVVVPQLRQPTGRWRHMLDWLPAPGRAGASNGIRGISKSGNRRLRKTMIELAWSLAVCHQPDSALSRWFQRGSAPGRDESAGSPSWRWPVNSSLCGAMSPRASFPRAVFKSA